MIKIKIKIKNPPEIQTFPNTPMKIFLTLLGREVKSFFYSPIAYVVLFYYLFLSGFNFYSQISIMNGYPTEVTVVEAFFMPALFWFPFVLSFPLITMRVYSEEYR